MGHFVLVHSACHGAWSWYKLKPLLEAAGHRVTAMDLAASGQDPTPIEQVGSIDEYCQPLLQIMQFIPRGERVVLVAESAGGVCITIAADKYPEKIAAVVYANAFMPDIEHNPAYAIDKLGTFFNNWKDTEFSTYKVHDETIVAMKLGFELMRTNIYQNCSAEDYELAKKLTRKGSLFRDNLAKRECFTMEGYGSVKRVYIWGEEDEIFVKKFHLWQIQNFKPDKVYNIPGSDHKMVFSKPQELLAYLLKIAAEYA